MKQEVNIKEIKPVLIKDVNINELILSSKQQLETMFDSITDPIILVTPDFTIERLNSAAAKMIGEDFRLIIGKKCYEKFHGQPNLCTFCPHSGAYQNEQKGNISVHKRIDNIDHIFDLRYFPLYDKNGHVRSVVEHYVDITEGEKAKRCLEEEFLTIKEEIQVAKNIQNALLPPELPKISGLKIEVHYKPVEEIGGDLYDFIPVNSENWGVIIADVSGHGIPASLMSAMAKMSFYNHTPGNLSTLDVFEKVNKDLFNNLMMEYYISGEYLIFDTLNHTMRYSRAGHPEGLLFRAETGQIEKLFTRGYFLGIMNNGEYEQGEYKLNKGDRIMLYTDGLMEMENPSGVKFGIENLRRILRENSHENLENVKAAFISSTENYRQGKKPEDDVTFILLEVTEDAAMERFKLKCHFSEDCDVRIFRAMHPFDFSKGIQLILDEMKTAWYPEIDKDNVRLAVYDALELVHHTSENRTEGICLAWQCGKEELRIVVTDNRFETSHCFSEDYTENYPDTLKSIQERMTHLSFPDGGRKIMLSKHNSKY